MDKNKQLAVSMKAAYENWLDLDLADYTSKAAKVREILRGKGWTDEAIDEQGLPQHTGPWDRELSQHHREPPTRQFYGFPDDHWVALASKVCDWRGYISWHKLSTEFMKANELAALTSDFAEDGAWEAAAKALVDWINPVVVPPKEVSMEDPLREPGYLQYKSGKRIRLD